MSLHHTCPHHDLRPTTSPNPWPVRGEEEAALSPRRRALRESPPGWGGPVWRRDRLSSTLPHRHPHPPPADVEEGAALSPRSAERRRAEVERMRGEFAEGDLEVLATDGGAELERGGAAKHPPAKRGKEEAAGQVRVCVCACACVCVCVRAFRRVCCMSE